MILTQQPLYAANTPDPFGVSNCDATRDLTCRRSNCNYGGERGALRVSVRGT